MTIKEKVQNAVNNLYREKGDVRPSALIEIAAPEDSPIHDAFEWDNSIAGHEYRLIQARKWIRTVEIIIEDQPVRYVHVPIIQGTPMRETYYKPISVVVQDDDEYARAITELLSAVNEARRAYREVKDHYNRAQENRKQPDFLKADKGFELIEDAFR